MITTKDDLIRRGLYLLGRMHQNPKGYKTSWKALKKADLENAIDNIAREYLIYEILVEAAYRDKQLIESQRFYEPVARAFIYVKKLRKDQLEQWAFDKLKITDRRCKEDINIRCRASIWTCNVDAEIELLGEVLRMENVYTWGKTEGI